MDSANSETGNGFMRSVEPYAARLPYMGTVGNVRVRPAARLQ